mmetsp:Transcript_136600/g.193183  ORF Transcript_136600/g.193183 Transcript_136600/m.193183 type:complete len:88 (+) Transcript_136600:105-368(+)
MKNWTKEDDELLVRIALQHKLDWKKITAKFNKLTNSKVTQPFLVNRYREVQNTDKDFEFTPERDAKILSCIEEYGLKWDKMAKELGC